MAIDVRCLPYMPLHIERLRRSKAWLRCKRRPEMAFYLMNLWMRAWHEVPAGSIEDDDDVLSDAAMCSPEEWERLKADVLQGWELHDGRWHHHVVTELAAEGLEKVEASRKRTEAARQARQQNRASSATTDAASSVTENVTDDAAEDVTLSNKKIKGREEESYSLPSEAHSTTTYAQAPKRTQGCALPDSWAPNDRHRAEAETLGRDPDWLTRQAEAMRNWALSNRNRAVARKADWDLTFLGWIRREHEKNPVAQPRASPSWAPVDTKAALERAMAKAGIPT